LLAIPLSKLMNNFIDGTIRVKLIVNKKQ